MKFYFAGSIRGGRDDAALYSDIINELKQYGTVLSEHIGDQDLTQLGNRGTPKEIHDLDIKWIRECDLLVAEVTQVSLGVGYEIGRALEMGKTILCLYRPQPNKNLSAMIRGSEGVVVKDYQTLEEAKQIIKAFLESNFS